jgi:hypothetical protein
MTFQDFLHYIRYNSDTDPLYLFDPYFADTVPEMDTAYKVHHYLILNAFSSLKSLGSGCRSRTPTYSPSLSFSHQLVSCLLLIGG